MGVSEESKAEAAKVAVPKTPTKVDAKVSPKGDAKSPKVGTEVPASKSPVKDANKSKAVRRGRRLPPRSLLQRRRRRSLRRRLTKFVVILCLLPARFLSPSCRALTRLRSVLGKSDSGPKIY